MRITKTRIKPAFVCCLIAQCRGRGRARREVLLLDCLFSQKELLVKSKKCEKKIEATC